MRGFFIFSLIVFILAASSLFLIIYLNSPPETWNKQEIEGIRDDSGNSVLFEIRSGESSTSVGIRLEQAGIIRNRFFWQGLSKIKNEYIKSGLYRIELPQTQMNIYSLFVSGEQVLIKVTVPEGVTLKRIAQIFDNSGICSADDFLAAASSDEIRETYNVSGDTMEGYLFPDTYLFPHSYPPLKIVTHMADNFFKRLHEISPESMNMDSKKINDKIIIASIVEREYRIEEEADLMAGVFYNRIDIGMALQSCATVVYVMTEKKGLPHPDILLNRDLEIDDSYNTYIYSGLPPGPICVPGKTALFAAFNPKPSDYLYFRLVDANDGRHYFSKTLDEHIKAGFLYTKKN